MCSGCSGLLLLPQQLIFTFDIIYGPGFGSTLAEICPGYLPHHLTGPRTYLCVFGSAMAVMDVGTRHVCATIGSTPKCWGEHFPPAQIEKKNTFARKALAEEFDEENQRAPLARLVFFR